jgi:hypothetical protein
MNTMQIQLQLQSHAHETPLIWPELTCWRRLQQNVGALTLTSQLINTHFLPDLDSLTAISKNCQIGLFWPMIKQSP